MKKIFISVLLILFLVLADFNLLEYIRPFGNKLNLLTVTLILFTLFYEFKLVLTLIILAGILKDMLSTTIFGLYTTAFLIGGLVMNFFSRWLLKENLWMVMLYTFMMTLFILSFLNALECMFKGSLDYFETIFLQSVIPAGLLNGLISPVLFKGLCKILR